MRAWLFTIGLIAVLCGSLHIPLPHKPDDTGGLEAVLKKMDAAAAGFHSAQADFEWDQYQKVVDETDVQKGTIYFRRSGQQIEMMAHVKDPDQKYVLYKDGKLQVYQPKIEQLIVHDLGNNRGDLAPYLVSGSGGSGQDLTKTFDVTYDGDETVGGIAAGRLVLVPKS